MPNSFEEMVTCLLPQPVSVAKLPGTLRWSVPRFELRVADGRISGEVDRLQSQWSAFPWSGMEHSAATRIRVCEDRRVTDHPQGYRITVSPDAVDVIGAGPAGCFYGLQTLAQIVDFAGQGDASRPRGADAPIAPRDHELPCLAIVDFPAFTTRGLLHDVTRGKTPRLETLKHVADRLAKLKVNQLQLYIEHAFVFNFDSDICDADHGLTGDEVKELDEYCKGRFIDLVPAVATLGHMGRILSLSRYRDLAEIEAIKEWSDMTWPERARGFTLDCMNPRAWELVERMWSEVLSAFSSPVVNICGDEPWDFGRGKNAGRWEGDEKGKAYLAHIARTHELCERHGRRVQFWSDVVHHYPDLLHLVPRDATVLHWGYDDRADYEGTGRFVNAGLDTAVCPGTSGWKRILNATNLAERNILTFARAGARHGATGLINTDWGDHGHFNSLGCSWHGIVLGAAAAWNPATEGGAAFDRAFSRLLFGDQDAAWVEHLRAASRIAESCETWRVFWQSADSETHDASIPPDESLHAAHRAAKELENAAKKLALSSHRNREVFLDATDLLHAARFTQMFVARLATPLERTRLFEGVEDLVCQVPTWTLLSEYLNGYRAVWHARNKPGGWSDIENAIDKVAKVWSVIHTRKTAPAR